MKTAVYCVSKNALKLAEKIKTDKRYDTDLYISKRIAEYTEKQDYVIIQGTLKETVKETFNIYDLHVFITAAGIAG